MIATRLLRLRTDAVLTQRELARLAGVSPATIVAAEKGLPIYPSTIRKLATALEVTPRALTAAPTPTETAS